MRMVAAGAESVVERPLDEWPPVPPALPGEPEAIFIVGASRSGTTLMRTILERSPRIAIARENHFVGHLRENEGARYYFRRVGDLREDDVVRKVVDLIYSGSRPLLTRRTCRSWHAPSNGANRASTPAPPTGGGST